MQSILTEGIEDMDSPPKADLRLFLSEGVGSTLRPVSPTGWKRSRRQNRYKSIICQEDMYFRELVRYIHLNPLRAKIVSDIKDLNKYP
jgi:REP element-mobilizing transposase RayT